MCKILDVVSNRKNITLDIRNIITQSQTTQAAHFTQKRMSVNELCNIYDIDLSQIEPIPKNVFIFDDILTKGTHFKAVQKMLKTVWPNANMFGLFIARSKYCTLV
ncbi:MAG: hypothetical protein WAW86_10650 [Gammaproteobacteria bacterium]